MSNISDVAKKAGVGVSTVSKVLNNYEHVSEETRLRVLAAVEELNYVPNAVAAALSSKNSNRIALVLFMDYKQAIDEINMQYLFGAFNRAKKTKYEIITVFSTVIEEMNKQDLIQYFNSLRVSSLIVFGLNKSETAFIEMLHTSNLQAVLIDAPIYNERVSNIMINHKQAQYEITLKMIKEHENEAPRLLYLAGLENHFVTQMRLEGFKKACEEQGIEYEIQNGNFSEKKAKELTHSYGRDADMIICASDLMAIGAISALKEMDIYRPVCGFDGIKLLGYVDYHVLTVAQDFYKLGQEALNEMHRLISEEKSRELRINYQIKNIHYEDIIV